MRGWILDLYPWKKGEMVLWLKTEKGESVRLVDKWNPSIYVSGNKNELKRLADVLSADRETISCEFDEKYVRIQDTAKSTVLKINTPNPNRLAKEVLQIGRNRKYQVYNVDVPSTQIYLYEKDIFPLAYVDAEANGGSVGWELHDSVESEDYRLPPLRIMHLALKVDGKTPIPSLRDPFKEITVKVDGQKLLVDAETENEKLQGLTETIMQIDPDMVITKDGDGFVLPYLARRALVNGLSEGLVLGRENTPLKVSENKGAIYFSYGRIYDRPQPARLFGRIHLDIENSFIYADCGLEGLIEVSRTCRMPLQRVANTTIGTSMTSLQLYQAVKDGILIPWKKKEPENFKSADELLIADRGGFHFEPKVGIHDGVGEIDFASMYPTLMMKKNISPETVSCQCCPDSSERVPELEYNICRRRRGIVPKTLELLLKKRADYKKLRNDAFDPQTKRLYDRRQAALKWILVCSFGYLGFKNAKFGKVDAHIAVCAYAREVLLKTAHLAEQRGFEIVHGIVDSLWLKKEGSTPTDFIEFCREVEQKLQLPVSFEGQYRWIVFLPSKTHQGVPVLSRFFGVFTDGRVKVRGLELRRHDTPPFIQRCQKEVISILAKAQNSKEFMGLIPEAVKTFEAYVSRLALGGVPLSELLIRKQLSQNPEEYRHNVLQAVAARKLVEEGVKVSAGQMLGYVIVDEKRREAVPMELLTEDMSYDAKKYIGLLISATSNILNKNTS